MRRTNGIHKIVKYEECEKDYIDLLPPLNANKELKLQESEERSENALD